MCHELWENESDDVKTLYERKAHEENGKVDRMKLPWQYSTTWSWDSTSKVDTSVDSMDDPGPRNCTDQPFIEPGVRRSIASLVAAYHIDVSTRDRSHVDLSRLLDKAIVFPSTLEEI
jgi:hypothetical protein